MTVENTTKPQAVYETVSMTADQVKELNDTYAALGVNARVVDVSQFCGKWVLQSDGTYKYSAIRKKSVKRETGDY